MLNQTERQMSNDFTYMWNPKNVTFIKAEGRKVVARGRGCVEVGKCWSRLTNLLMQYE